MEDKNDEKLTWKLTLEGTTEGPEDDIELEFIDTSNILGEPTIERQFIDTIINLTSEHNHYSLFKNLKKIISDSGEDLSSLAIWALMGVVKENLQKLGILLGALPDGNIHIIAVWPTAFSDQLRADPSLIEDVIEKFGSDPNFWVQADLIVGFI
jgi:hypothetical protein